MAQGKLSIKQTIFYVILFILAAIAAVFGGLCIYFEHLFEGAVILSCDIILFALIVTTMRADKGRNKFEERKQSVKDAADELIYEFKNVDFTWAGESNVMHYDVKAYVNGLSIGENAFHYWYMFDGCYIREDRIDIRMGGQTMQFHFANKLKSQKFAEIVSQYVQVQDV